ncbi:MAG: transketolase family protein [Ndongobacter sp.]|nr:transketolase family protein [Ndongobacter sp.]
MSDEKIATRVAYGKALLEIGADERIVALDADLGCCTRTDAFAERYPDRHFNVGIAEANMVGVAAGMATCGKKPYVHSFAMFLAGRAFEQIRNSVCYPNVNVVLAGTHAGLTVGKDGATHQCLEDIGLMRVLPNMKVFVPADQYDTEKLVRLSASLDGPAYIRLSRYEGRNITDPEAEVHLGGSHLLRSGDDVTIFACGLMVERAMDCAARLEEEGISVRVIDVYCVKPIDRARILAASRETACLVSMEEHNIYTGMGSAVAEVLSEEPGAPLLRIGVEDAFGKSGDEEQLLEDYGLSTERLVTRIRAFLEKRKEARR